MNELVNQDAAYLNHERPSVVISMDFELRWGVHDKLGLNMDAYRGNLENVRMVVPALLKLFSERNIRATWACVGALGCNDWNEYFLRAPATPNYRKANLKLSPQYADLDPEGRLYFAPELLHLINRHLGQELGSHTFSHIFACEQGVSRRDVYDDLVAVNLLFKEKFGAEPISLVFPRNQDAFLSAIAEAGIRIWRGNERAWYYSNCIVNSYILRKISKPLRFSEAINPFVKYSDILRGNMTRSSLFLRFNLPEVLWKLHFARIKRELNSLKAGEIFHIWCHPHNLGADVDKRLARMKNVLDLIADKCSYGAVVSRNMADLALGNACR